MSVDAGWILERSGGRCTGNNYWTGAKATLDDCKAQCEGQIYMTYVPRGDRNCACQTECTQTSNTATDLYKHSSGTTGVIPAWFTEQKVLYCLMAGGCIHLVSEFFGNSFYSIPPLYMNVHKLVSPACMLALVACNTDLAWQHIVPTVRSRASGGTIKFSLVRDWINY